MWKKSTFSGGMGNCVEVDLEGFRKSSFSGTCGSCVEVAMPGDQETIVKVRDDKLADTPDGSPVLEFTRPEWQAFIDGVKAGEFDLTD